MADPDVLEVAPGASREKLQGSVPQLATPDDLRAALEQAFDYRGGQTLEDSVVRLLPKDGGGKVSVRYADIAALAFTGRDMAAGNSWESWVRQYWTKKSAGESDISLQPENLE
jgi:hypothetical protein